MARLRNVTSGAIVEVPDEKAARLGSEWAPVEVAQEKPARQKKSEADDAVKSDKK